MLMLVFLMVRRSALEFASVRVLARKLVQLEEQDDVVTSTQLMFRYKLYLADKVQGSYVIFMNRSNSSFEKFT